jgi:hypothetical protein
MVAGKMIYVDSTLASFAFLIVHDLGSIFFPDHLNQVGADVPETEYEAFDPTSGFKS